uniref:Inner centromere protein ARK-binding domain-containing protein n=1 Tax=Acrobeloides nanus TaxID=290746 RepID=A0A914DNI1_9BILA
MPPKRGGKTTRGKTKVVAQELPVPDFTPMLNVIDFNKLDRILEKTLAKHFYNELETAMNELAEQKQRFKGIVSSHLGENKVPHTPKKNPPGALAWRQIGEHKALNFESDDDVTADGEASILRDAPELRNVSPILPTRRMLDLNQIAGPTPNRSRDLFVESPQPKKAEVVVPSPRPIPIRQTLATRERNTPEFPPHFVMIEPIDQDLIPKHANGGDEKRELDAISTISGSTTSIPNTVSTFTGVGPSRIPKNFAKPVIRIEDDKTVKVKQIEEKLNHAVQNHEEILKEKAERARRDREERTRRVEMNNLRKQQQEQEQIQETKTREQKLREFQAVQQMQQSLTPKSLRSIALGTTSQNTRIPVLTPNRQAIPFKKTKQDAASPFTLPSRSPAFVSQNSKRKLPKPNVQEKAHSKQELKKISVDPKRQKISVDPKRQVDIQKALEAERVLREQEERDRIKREHEREAERIRMEEERRARAEEMLRLEEDRRKEAERSRMEEERRAREAEALRLEENCRREIERRIQEEQQIAAGNQQAEEEESMIIDSDERIAKPEENDADVESATDLTERIQELSMVDTQQDDDDEGKENNAQMQPTVKPYLPQPLNKTLEKVASANKSSYDITPAKVFLPSTVENYNVDDLSSNDSTDDEERPRKTIPQWARSSNLVPYVRKIDKNLNVAARSRHFGTIQAPNIVELFPSQKKYPARTSSAIWTSPLSNPTPGYSRYQQYASNSSKYN